MPAESPFIVEVRDLPAKRRIDVPATLVAEALAGLPMREALDDAAKSGGGVLDVELYADGTHVFASGTLEGELAVACSRCVGPVTLKLDEPVHVTFMPRGELASLDEEAAPADEEDGAEVASEDVDVFPYDGEKVDLEPLVREQFVLAVPYAPLCKEACAGLCPQCGIDKNLEACSCEAPPDPRFAALRGLKLPS